MPVLQGAFRITLWLLIIAGLGGALRVSYATVTGTAPCPDVAAIPVCYLVAIGYVSMLAAQLASPGPLREKLFYPAWALVFMIALVGTGVEITVGNTCPQSNSGVPLCYFSLALSGAIILFYRLQPASPAPT